MSEKQITRVEYYKQQGFSGSDIERPDDPVDADFIKHCEGLKAIMEGFIDYCKTGESAAPFMKMMENHVVEINSDESIITAIKSSDDILHSLRDLVQLYTRLQYLYSVKSLSNEKVLTGPEFAQRAILIADSHSAAIQALVAHQKVLETKLQDVKHELSRAKHQHDYIGAINRLANMFDIDICP